MFKFLTSAFMSLLKIAPSSRQAVADGVERPQVPTVGAANGHFAPRYSGVRFNGARHTGVRYTGGRYCRRS